MTSSNSMDIKELKEKHPLIEVARRLGLGPKVYSSGNTVAVRCFAHEDENPSLVLKPRINRYECKTCGIKGDIFNLIQGIRKCTFKEALEWLSPERVVKRASDISPQDYLTSRGLTDETLQKFGVRVDKDKITIPLPTGEKYRWFKGEGKPRYTQKVGTSACLFRTDAEPGDTLILTEGEIDALVVWQHTGLPAWSSSGGAGTFLKKWKSEFEGIQKIFIGYDNDDQGREGAEIVSKILGEKRCFRLQVPEGGGKDWSDYFALGYTKEDFDALLVRQEGQKVLEGMGSIEAEVEKEGTKQPLNESEKFFTPALHFDLKGEIAYIALPKLDWVLSKKNKTKLVTRIFVVTSKQERWELTPEECKKRRLIPISTPHFGKLQPRWSGRYVEEFLGGSASLDPYKDVFLPIEDVYEENVDFAGKPYSTLLAIWVLSNYIYPLFPTSPYIRLGGHKRSGKTKVIDITGRVAFNAESVANSSPSFLFRVIESNLSAVLIDESEMLSYKDVNSEFRLLLNAGYKIGATAGRVNPNTLEPQRFVVRSPKMLASIRELDDTLADRCIPIIMLRATDKEKSDREITETTADWEKLRNGLYRFALEHGLAVSAVYQNSEKITQVHARHRELWKPLLATAEYVDKFNTSDKSVFESVAVLAKEHSEEDDCPLDSWETALLRGLETLVSSDRKYTVAEIKNAMTSRLEDPGDMEKISHKWVGSNLRKSGFKRDPKRATGGGTQYRISPEKVEDLLMRFGIKTEEEENEHSEGSEGG